jgi:hypothetical protein
VYVDQGAGIFVFEHPERAIGEQKTEASLPFNMTKVATFAPIPRLWQRIARIENPRLAESLSYPSRAE